MPQDERWLLHCLLCYYFVQGQKLPRCVVPPVMDDHQGDMTIISADKIYFRGTYLIAPRRDGQLEINEWSQLLSECELKIGDRWISMLHHGDARVSYSSKLFLKERITVLVVTMVDSIHALFKNSPS